MYTKIGTKRKSNKERNILPINEYLIDTIQDIQTLPTQISRPIYERCGAGSTALCIEEQTQYILNNNNQWKILKNISSNNNNNNNNNENDDSPYYLYIGNEQVGEDENHYQRYFRKNNQTDITFNQAYNDYSGGKLIAAYIDGQWYHNISTYGFGMGGVGLSFINVKQNPTDSSSFLIERSIWEKDDDGNISFEGAWPYYSLTTTVIKN